MLNRDEAAKPGVYFLSGINPETGRERVYIGEAEVIRNRIKGHMDRDFWKSLVFFVSKDENLTKAHIKYLEGKLIETARSIGRFELENAQASGSHLPESDAADMDVFFSRMEQLLPILGQEFLKPVVNEANKKSSLLFCEIKGLKATGRQTDNGFVVLKGSEAVLSERPSTQKYQYAANLRATLRSDGILEEKSDRLIFASDYEFSSPSAAAAVIHGGQANGLIAWKDVRGVTLKEREEMEVQQAPGGAEE
ncbi:GIY-YIG nuclease family protein [Prosthecochloris aestuarii]|nr:GIY-YIG nuclease family protein [Prosthecochloris aestuarii]